MSYNETSCLNRNLKRFTIKQTTVHKYKFVHITFQQYFQIKY